MQPLLKKQGWWGRKEVVDPKTGEVVTAQLGSPHRLETIFRTNLRTAYANGHWDSIERLKERRPYLRYTAVMDGRTRPEHRAWHGTILPIDDEWWQTHAPPNGWMCRCRVVSLSEGQMSRAGWKVSKRPESPTRPVLNKRTGETVQVPVGIDLGWDYNPGLGANRRVEAAQNLASKVEAEREDAKKTAEAAEAKKPAAKKRAAPRKKKPAGPKPETAARFKRRLDDDLRLSVDDHDDIHRNFPGYVDEEKDERTASARAYIGPAYESLNKRMREKEPLTIQQKEMVDTLRKIAVDIPERKTLYRGIGFKDPLLNAAEGDIDFFPTPLSTATTTYTPFNFASEAYVVMHLKPGVRGVVWNAIEQEVTLLPGARWRVIKTQKFKHNGLSMRLINVEVDPGRQSDVDGKMDGMPDKAKSSQDFRRDRPFRKSTMAERVLSESQAMIRLDPDDPSRALDPADQPALDHFDQIMAEVRGE